MIRNFSGRFVSDRKAVPLAQRTDRRVAGRPIVRRAGT